MKKLFRITTVSSSLDILLKGQLRFLSDYYDITAISSGSLTDLNKVGKREHVHIKRIPMKRDISFFIDIISFFYLFFFFLKNRPFIVHSNTPKSSLLSMIAAFFAFIPHRVYTVTGLRFETTHGFSRFVLLNIERITCFFATKIIPEGKGVKQKLLSYHITSKPLHIIHNGNINGIDISFFNKSNYLSNSSIKPFLHFKKTITFVFVGRLVKDKGIYELYNAFSKFNSLYSDSSLLCIGPIEDSSNALSDSLLFSLKNHNSIFLTGFQSDIRPFLAIADVFLFPSYREGFPNVLLQAGAMSLPLISSNVNGADEIILDGINGFIIPTHDSESLFNKMLFFIKNRDQIDVMGKKCRDIVESRFRQEDVWIKTLEMYATL